MARDKHDVVVIGAGIVGLATAYEVAKRGLTVLVVDDHQPGWAASTGNAGMVYPAAGEPMVNPHHMKAGIGWVLTRGGQSPLQFSLLKLPSIMGWGFRALFACTQENHTRGKAAMQVLGADALQQFETYKQDGVEYEEHPGGFLSCFIKEKELEKIATAFSGAPGVEILTGDQAREGEPLLGDDIVGAVQLTEGFTSVYPPTVCTGLARRLLTMGVDLRTDVHITGGVRDGSILKALETSSGATLAADHFVLAAGGWSGKLARKLGSKTSITGGKGYAITIDDPSAKPGQTLFLNEYEAVAIPFDGKIRFTGFLELSGVNMKILPRRIRALRKVAARYLKQVPEGKAEVHWTGMRACTPDGVPAIGRMPKTDNLWLGSGHWHFGLTLAPPTGLMLAELITTGESTVDAGPFDPRRF